VRRRLGAWSLRLGVFAALAGAVVKTLVESRYSASQWFDLVVFGITIGSIYALVALGYTMVYGVLRMINFAHGDITMTGAFAGYFAIAACERTGLLQRAPIVAVGVTLVVSIIVATASALLVERIAYRPFGRTRNFAPLICAIGASFFLEQTFRAFFGSSVKSYPDLPWGAPVFEFGGLRVPKIDLMVVACALTAMTSLYILIHKTRIGTAIRAVSEDADAASLMGIDAERVVVLCFALGGAMAAIAGVFYALVFHQVHFFMGFMLGIKAFGSAVLGGIGNVLGAMLGGIALGIFESAGPPLLLDGIGVPAPYQLRDLLAFVLIILVLVLRPQGLLGERLPKLRA
jgi:branched-chain amino acid transport system permease protein